MIDSLVAFWDFFFFPIYNFDSIDLVAAVLVLCLTVYAVDRFLSEVFSCVF